MKTYKHQAFSGYGIEIEFMIVADKTLDILPVADQLLDLVGGAEDMDIERGDAAWSNELALHVVEVKTNGPTSDLPFARQVFRQQVKEINDLLIGLGGRLMPGGMHPWMDPLRETRLWPHQNKATYNTFDRIFGCHGHGWSNLQSTHINLPFSTPDEFARLHAACRFVLPLIPALSASSPYVSGRLGPGISTRLLVYRKNCSRIASVAGVLIPERIYTEEAYMDLLDGIYQDLRPHDPEGVLAHEWVNSRGCIARFDRGAIEIRLMDAQESPGQDLALVSFVTGLVQALATEQVQELSSLKEWDEHLLSRLLLVGAEKGQKGEVLPEYCRAWGYTESTFSGLLQHLAKRFPPQGEFAAELDIILERGNLAERLVQSAGPEPDSSALKSTYEALSECLAEDRPFIP